MNCGEWVCVGCHQSLDSCSAAGVRRQQQQLKPSSSSGQLALRAGPSCGRTQARRERAGREAAFQRCPARTQVRAVVPIDRRTVGPRVDWLLRSLDLGLTVIDSLVSAQYT